MDGVERSQRGVRRTGSGKDGGAYKHHLVQFYDNEAQEIVQKPRIDLVATLGSQPAFARSAR
jgi:hypothetical protein